MTESPSPTQPGACPRAALCALGRHEEALADYGKVVTLRPRHVAALNRRGIALAALKRPEEALAAYDAALVILDAIKRVAASGKEVTRDAVRDAMQTSHVKTIQGEIAFDENGDLQNRVISVFRIVKDDKYPPDDVLHKYKYLGVAPQSS